MEKERREWRPVEDLADLLVDDHDAWTEADLEEMEGWDQPVVSEEA